ncbi:GNAT family N-acetyltransferase [Bacillus sp. JJ1122]|uniref:GNAT family N-acetyltransferase n=1 Tax=Bacillus sp. JJ1122 TaxID=3122951 RepID=UPI002FFE18A6
MKVEIRQAVDSDRDIFIEYAVKLSNFNRNNHSNECTYDNYESVINTIKQNAYETFNSRNDDTLILIAELEGTPVGYALGRIFEENEAADNGTGRMGLFDELFLEDAARGHGLGQRLLDETVNWMKDKGINRIKLHAYSWNDHAKKLYARNGFKEYAVSYETFI